MCNNVIAKKYIEEMGVQAQIPSCKDTTYIQRDSWWSIIVLYDK
jgi:hypothetical protein